MQTRRLWTLIVAVAVVTAACGDSKSSLIPTAPSALSAETTNVDASAAAAGYVTTGNGPRPGNGNGNGNGTGGNTGTSPAPVAFELEGLIEAFGVASITVNGREIAVTDRTVLRHGDRTVRFSDLCRGDRVHVDGTSTGSTAEATQIKVQNPTNQACVGPPPPPPADSGHVSVSAADDTANEAGAEPGVFRLTREGTPGWQALPLTVHFNLNGTAGSNDYAPVELSARFGANQTTVDVTITPITDRSEEGAETVVLTLTSATPYSIGTPASATLSIQDAPFGSVSVASLDDASEVGPDSGSFRLTRQGSSVWQALPLTVQFALSGTAGPSDYAPVVLNATFAANEATVDVAIMPITDRLDEGPENVVVTLTSAAPYDLGTASTATLTIQDAPFGSVSVATLDGAAFEFGADPGVFRLTRVGSSVLQAAPLTVHFTLNGTAVAGDYAPVLLSATFAPHQPTVDVEIKPINDGVGEGAETVVLTLTNVGPYDIGVPATATVTIKDVPPAIVNVEVPDPFAGEIANEGRFVIRRSGGNTGAELFVTVQIGGSATNGTDYNRLENTYRFGPDQLEITLFVAPTDDEIPEGAETIELSVIDVGDTYDLGPTPSGTITIAAR
jgi:hypothetical protein